MKLRSSASKDGNRNRIITLIVAVLGAILVAWIWKFNSTWQYYDAVIVGNSVGLFFIPVLAIILLREDLTEFGFCIGDSRKVRWLVLGAYIGLVCVMVYASRRADYQGYYPIFARFFNFPIIDKFGSAIGYGLFNETNIQALVYGWITYGMYMLFWEFFFRGFLLFGLYRTIKWPAVIIQAVAFGFLHCGKPSGEMYLSYGAGIILGILALRAKSFLPGFALHWAAFVTFDLLVMVSRHR